jgi:hypothetical protein
MIILLTSIAILTAIFSLLVFLVQRKVVSIYRGVFFIVLSGLYFSAVFLIAYFLRESFQ